MAIDHPEVWIDGVQTAAIIAVFGVLIYVIRRLEGQISAWAKALAEINARLLNVAAPERAALVDSFGRAWQRIEALEKRLEALERELAKRP